MIKLPIQFHGGVIGHVAIEDDAWLEVQGKPENVLIAPITIPAKSSDPSRLIGFNLDIAPGRLIFVPEEEITND